MTDRWPRRGQHLATRPKPPERPVSACPPWLGSCPLTASPVPRTSRGGPGGVGFRCAPAGVHPGPPEPPPAPHPGARGALRWLPGHAEPPRGRSHERERQQSALRRGGAGSENENLTHRGPRALCPESLPPWATRPVTLPGPVQGPVHRPPLRGLAGVTATRLGRGERLHGDGVCQHSGQRGGQVRNPFSGSGPEP